MGLTTLSVVVYYKSSSRNVISLLVCSCALSSASPPSISPQAGQGEEGRIEEKGICTVLDLGGEHANKHTSTARGPRRVRRHMPQPRVGPHDRQAHDTSSEFFIQSRRSRHTGALAPHPIKIEVRSGAGEHSAARRLQPLPLVQRARARRSAIRTAGWTGSSALD
eukprot:scaffold1248_cov122-Isochrysis_galbana.AAC.12